MFYVYRRRFRYRELWLGGLAPRSAAAADFSMADGIED
jgi:hypothetical protein